MDKRETDREGHEERMKKIDYSHDVKIKELDIKKDEISKEH